MQLDLTEQQQPIAALLLTGFLAYPGQQSNELWCQGASRPPAAGQPPEPGRTWGHLTHSKNMHCPPAAQVLLAWAGPRIWRKPKITARAVFKHLLCGWTVNLTTKVVPQNTGGTKQPLHFYTTQPNVKHLLKILNIHLQKLSLCMGSHGDKSNFNTQKKKSYSTDHPQISSSYWSNYLKYQLFVAYLMDMLI